MIDAIVSINGEDFEVRAQTNVYDGELLDFNAAYEVALAQFRIRFPLDSLESASLEVCFRRVHTEVAARDGEGVETARFGHDPVYPEEA